MKKACAVFLMMSMTMIGLTACGNKATKSTTGAETINVISREDGSGTRSAFVELFGIEQKNDLGEKIDYTTEEAEITNSTAVMMTTIAGNKQAIGYVSLGSLNDTVKAVAIDETEASVENIKNNRYKIARPFNIAVRDNLSDAGKDFIAFIMSEDGQKIVEDNHYISQKHEGAYIPTAVRGKVIVAGSSSVTPIMEKLKEAYEVLNPNVTIEVQQSDSTTGLHSAIEGICDIGMTSRDLKDSELIEGLKQTVIAIDGIAVIVNKESRINELSSEQVKDIFTGKIMDWKEVQ